MQLLGNEQHIDFIMHDATIKATTGFGYKVAIIRPYMSEVKKEIL